MACGTPVAALDEPTLREVGGNAAVFGKDLTECVRRALAQRDRLAAAGLRRAREFSWDETGRRTAQVYRDVLAR
jgi:glycosyltransferase involved in cell wall biosynthesis